MKKRHKSTILIVDDQEINRAILADLFSPTYEVIEAQNGLEALNFLRAKKKSISVVILDVVMPVMDGFTLLEKLHEEKIIKQIPIIMITAENSVDSAVKGYKLGVFDFISKPFNPEIVLHRVKIVRELYDHRRNLEKLLERETQIIWQQSKKLQKTNSFVIDALSSIVEFRHGESGNHVRRLKGIVRLLLTTLAKTHPELGLDNEKINMYAEASAMHDLGKISVPDSILLKPGPLTPQEREIMNKHPLYGCEILESLNYDSKDEFFATCYDIVRHHHERYDGKGYPDGLKGDEISLAAQVVALADVYDALTTPRVYKKAYSHNDAIRLINDGQCGGSFNPLLLEVLNSLGKKLANVNTKYEELPLNIPLKQTEEPISPRTLHLIEVERRKQQMISNLSGEVMFDYDFASQTITFSEKGQEVFGFDLIIDNFMENIINYNVIAHHDVLEIKKLLNTMNINQPNAKFEVRLKDKKGQYRWYEIKFCLLFDDIQRTSAIGKLVDIDDMKRKYENLREMADIDVLTKLYNRRAFIEIVSSKLRSDTRGFFVLLDLDNFKEINDTYGHLVGDTVLSQIASDLKSKIRNSDVLARLGGDEFAIFIEDIDRDSLKKILKRLCVTQCNINGETHQVSKSIGVAVCPNDGIEYSDLMHKADVAMYNAKGASKSAYSFFDELD